MNVRSRSRVVAALVVALLAALAPSGMGPNPADAQTPGAVGVWETTGSLSVPRYDHTTTLLESGEVLAAAGRRVAGAEPPTLLQSAELYNPRTETWSPTGSLAEARWSHTATLLQDGTVLVAGGFGDPYAAGSNTQPVLASAEIYDPDTGTWSPTGSLNTRRALHTATLLVDGRVLVTGGRTCNEPPPVACNFTFRSDSAEIYDPSTGTWSPTGPLTIPRHTTSAVMLQSGGVLIPAGFTSAGNGTTADRYDPAAVASTETGPLNVGRARQGAMLLENGQVLVAAGFGAGVTSELYDPDTDTWSLTGELSTNRFNFFFTVLPDGRALIAGGAVPFQGVIASAEIYDPATGQWSPADDMNEPHGSSGSLSNSSEAIVLSSDPWSFEADPAVCGDNCGKVLVAGYSATGSAELYDPAVSLEITDTVRSDGTRGQVTGSLTCPAGEVFLVEVELTQDGVTGQGKSRGTCTGTPQSYTANFTTGAGTSLSSGPAEACVTLNTAPRGARTTTHNVEVCEEVIVSI